jgi:hypothetical protein
MLESAGDPNVSQPPVQRRWVRWLLWPVAGLLAVTLLPWLLCMALIEIRCVPIRQAGGRVGFGPPLIYNELAYSGQYPQWVGSLCRSRVGHWYFQQFPVAYTVDLRYVRDPARLERGLEGAAAFRHLRQLTLYMSAVRDEHLAGLQDNFPELTHLSINETNITDDGIRHLRGHTSLEYVNVQRTKITDEAVADLATLPRLKELAIAETRVTSVEAIRKSRPMCRIHGVLNVAKRCKGCNKLLGECRCPERQRRGWTPPVLDAAGLERPVSEGDQTPGR